MGAVREAKTNDIDEIVDMLIRFHSESAFSHVSLSESRLNQFVLHTISAESRACFVYEMSDKKLAGCCFGYCAPYFFSEELGAWDLLVYVLPERRGTIVAPRLVRSLLGWAHKIGVSTIWFGTAAGIGTSRTGTFYKRMGMREVGSLYQFKLNN